jgi:dihydrofolate reductase
MRRVLYRVAASLDGYIAGPLGEVDWIVHDPAVDFAKLYESVDAVLLGRRTYELTRQPGAPPWPQGWQIYVFSRTLPPEEHPGVTFVKLDAGARVAALRAAPGRGIWLFGGGSLFRSLLRANQVDFVEVMVVPVLLGGSSSPADWSAADTTRTRAGGEVSKWVAQAAVSCPRRRRCLTRACSRRADLARGAARAAPSGECH